MIQATAATGSMGVQYSEEGARIARHSLEMSGVIADSYDKDKCLEQGLEEIRKAATTTLDEKIIAQFGIDAISNLKNRQDTFEIFCAVREVALSAIGAAMPGTMGNVLMGIAREAALKSTFPEDGGSLETTASNDLAFHKGMSILANHKASTPEEMAIKDMGARVLRSLSNDERSRAAQHTAAGTAQGTAVNNEELTARAATILDKAIASSLQGSLGATIATVISEIVKDDLSTHTKNCILGQGISAIQYSPQSTPVEKALARYSSNTTVDMLDGDYSTRVSAAILDVIAAPPSDIEYRALAAAAINAAGQYTSWGDRDRRDVLNDGLRSIAENKSSSDKVKRLAKDAMACDEGIRDHKQAVEAMLKVLREIELMQSPKEAVEIEFRNMAESLAGEASSPVEIDDEFVDIDGIRLKRNTL
jgi:hypothetical protein